MMPGRSDTILRHLNRLLVTQEEQTDAQLLRRFATQREESAFAALLSRHGRLVWDVCRHTLNHEHDAEDAFQATFLVLARKAGSIRKGESVGSFLYGVAYRTSLKARRRAAARRHREEKTARPDAQPPTDAGLRELQTILAEEVSRLAPKYRTPFVLCCLEGMSKREAADELGWKEGTVSSRLANARKVLHARLTRRGVVLAAALTTAAVAVGSASAVPAALLTATLQAAPGFAAGQHTTLSAPAAALTEGVLHAMFVTKLQKLVLVAAVVMLVVAGSVALGRQAFGPKPTVADKGPVEVPNTDNPESRKVVFKDNRDSLPPADKEPERAPSWAEPLKLKGHTMAIGVAVASPDGKLFATGDADAGLKLWNAQTGELVKTLDPRAQRFVIQDVCGLAFSPDSKTLAVGIGNIGVSLWDVDKGKKVRDLEAGDAERIGMGPLFFAPDGKTLFAGPRFQLHYPETKWPDNIGPTFRAWETESGKLLRSFGGTDGFWTLAMSRDGKLLASGAVKKADVVLWDAETGKELRRFKFGGTGNLGALAFAPDGKAVAVGGMTGTVELRDVKTGAEIRTFEEPPDRRRINGLSFSSDGKLLAVASGADKVAVFDAATSKLVAELKGPEGAVESVTFAAQGYDLLAGGADRAVWLWKAQTDALPTPGKWKVSDTFPGREKAFIEALAFSPDGKLFVAADSFGIGVWDVTGKKKVVTFDREKNGWFAFARFAADGVPWSLRRSEGKSAPGKWARFELYDPIAGKTRATFKDLWADGVATAFDLSPNGDVLATAEGKRVVLWDAKTGEELATLPGRHHGPIYALAFSRDGKTLASSGTTWVDEPGEIKLWDVARRREVGTIGGARNFQRLEFSPDGKTLAVDVEVADSSSKVSLGLKLFDAMTGKELAYLKQSPAAQLPNTHAFAPDGKTILVSWPAVKSDADSKPRLVLYDGATGKEVGVLPSDVAVTALAFSADGKMLATGDVEHTIRWWAKK